MLKHNQTLLLFSIVLSQLPNNMTQFNLKFNNNNNLFQILFKIKSIINSNNNHKMKNKKTILTEFYPMT